MSFYKIFINVFALWVLLFFTSCSDKGDNQAQMGPIPVSTFNIETKDITLSFEYPTQLTSLQSVDIYARVEGTLLEQKFVEGSMVKEGDKLFKIDPSRYQANVNSAKAQLLSAQASLREASKTWERAKKLFNEKALSPRERDQALAAYDSARGAVANAQASLDNAMIDLGYTDVVATASGRAGIKRYDIGDLVGSAGANNILTTITQLDPIHAEFSIPSNDYFFIRTLDRDNIKVSYILPDGNPYPKAGKIDFIDSVIDKNTATVKARAIVENPDHLLIPGEFSRIKIENLILKESVAIPQIALLQDANGSYVYRIVDGKATQTPVELGYTFGKNVIIKSGLLTGDTIITSQLIKLRPGAPVTPMNTPAPTNAPKQ